MHEQGIDWASYLAEGAPSPPADVEAPLRQARALLLAEEVKTEEIASLPTALQLALIERAASRGQVALVQAAEQAPSKLVAKAARRALHHLRSRRVKLSKKIEKAPPLRFSEETLPSYASPSDPKGDRVVLLLRRVPPEGYYLFEAILSEEQGILRFTFPGLLPRGMARRFIEETRQQMPLPLVAAPTAYVRALIEEGIRRATSLSRLPEEAAGAIPHLGPSALSLDPHPVHKLLHPKARPDSTPEKLFEDASLKNFAPPEEDLRRIEQALYEVDTSKLYVDDAQRARGRDDAIDRIALRAFQSEDTRQKFRRRLEDTAFLLFHEEKHEQAADLLYYAQEVASPQEKNYAPFARALYQSAFSFAPIKEKPEEEARSPSGLILP